MLKRELHRKLARTNRELAIAHIQTATCAAIVERLAFTIERASMALRNDEEPRDIAEDLEEALEDTTARLQEVQN